MDETSLTAFADELDKIAGVGDWWRRFTDVFRSRDEKNKRRVDYHFSPKAGPDKWKKLVRNAQDPAFAEQFARHPESTDKDTLHVQRMGELGRARTVAKIKSSRLPGRSYEIREVSGGLACTCPDWRFKGSIDPNYECKHIKAHRAGKVKADGVS